MFFTIGMQNFPSNIKGFEGKKFYCARCHNVSMELRKDHQFFTICFIPLIPISFSKNLSCPICSYRQDVSKQQLESIQNQPPEQHDGKQGYYIAPLPPSAPGNPGYPGYSYGKHGGSYNGQDPSGQDPSGQPPSGQNPNDHSSKGATNNNAYNQQGQYEGPPPQYQG